jgi:hypothetical protein
MPRGLDSVVQPFGIDATSYKQGRDDILGYNRDIIASVDELIRKQQELGFIRPPSGMDQGLAQMRQLIQSHNEYVAMAARAHVENDALNASHRELARSLVESGASLKILQDGYQKYANAVDAAHAANERMNVRQLNRDYADMLVTQREVTANTERMAASADHAALAYSRSVTALRETIKAGTAAVQQGGVMAEVAALQGGGGDVGALRAAIRAAGGGGGGGAGGLMTAGGYADSIINWTKRWAGMAHYAIMGVNEALAVLLPAATAAGAATLVAWQGGEQAVNRLKAITSTAEAIGPAYGITAGSYLGTGSALQQYQNLATGGVYELGGAGISLMRQGQGAIGQMGLNTLAMVDRGVANMQINMQKRGTMATLQGVLGGGTDYLRQLGDIGANVGNLFLGLAPNLPGVGGDYLSTIEGITGTLAGTVGWLNRPSIKGIGNLPFSLSGILGTGLAAEAGWRVGTPAVGLAGRGLQGLGGLLGKVPGLGSGGLTGADVKAISALTGIDLEAGTGASGLAGLLTGAGEGLAALTGPEVALAAMGAYGLNKFATYKPGPDQQMMALQSQIDQAGFTQAWQPLTKAIVTASVSSAQVSAKQEAAIAQGALVGPFGAGGGAYVTYKPLVDQAYQAGFTQQLGNLIGAGPSLVKALQSGPGALSNVSMAQAYQIAQLAMIPLSDVQGGKLNAQGIQMLQNYGTGIRPMTQSGGAFGAAVSGQYIMSQKAMQDVSSLNQAMDSLTQIMTGGPVGLSALSAAGQNVPSGLAQALTSFTAPGAAAAWSAFASPSTTTPGFITQLQSQMDQYRTAMAMNPSFGALVPGLVGYQMQPFLASARNSPAALAMLMQQAVQGGISADTGIAGGYYNPAMSQAQNYQALVDATKKVADNSTTANQAMTKYVEQTSNLPATASNFLGQLNPTLQTAMVSDASTQTLALRNAALAGGGVNVAAAQQLQADLKSSGLSGSALKSSFNAALQQAGVSQGMQMKIDAKVNWDIPKPPVPHITADASDAVTKAHQATNAINAVVGKHVQLDAATNAPAVAAAANAAMNSVQNQTRTLTIVENLVTTGTGATAAQMQAAGFAPGVSSSQLLGSIQKQLGHQTGGLVPGTGSGDITPAMLEPGEAIVPRYLVPLIAPILAAHGVPGFGAPMSRSSHFAAGGVVPVLDWTATNQGGQLPLPATVNKVTDSLLKSLQGSQVWNQFTTEFMGQFASSIKNLPTATKNLATSLVNQITTEVGYAKNVSGAAQYGQGFDLSGKGTGIFGSMDVANNGSVFDQMQTYLQTVQSFGTDIGTLRKGGLNKDIIGQLLAAGPVQGDALAQSILQGGGTTGIGGGIGGVNSLWGQIGRASTALGAQATMAQYGNYLNPSLTRGSFAAGGATNNVSINITANGGSSLDLSTSQVNQLVALIQAKLLQQARRNTKTGVQAKGKGA